MPFITLGTASPTDHNYLNYNEKYIGFTSKILRSNVGICCLQLPSPDGKVVAEFNGCLQNELMTVHETSKISAHFAKLAFPLPLWRYLNILNAACGLLITVDCTKQ